MKKNKEPRFRKGDRIMVHATNFGEILETVGTVLLSKNGRLKVELEKLTTWTIYAHPKQCRKLEK